MIGKGTRGRDVIESMKKNKAVYFVATGGAGALLSKCIKKVKVIAYDELGTEAIHELYVENFPVIVAIDSNGNNLFEYKAKSVDKRICFCYTNFCFEILRIKINTVINSEFEKYSRG